MYSKRSYEDILNYLLERLTVETDITLTTPGGVARTIMEVITKELSTNFNIFDFNFAQGFVSTASGTSLDKFGTLFGLTRKSVDSSINAEARTVYFYLNSDGVNHERGIPNLAAVTDVTIPANTYISTDEISSIGNPIIWKTKTAVTISAGYYLTYVTVEPVNGGDISVGVGKIINHGLDTSLYPNLYVYNKNALVTNTSYESDENYRYRIINGLRLLAAGNQIAFRIATLGIAGVRDVSITPLKYGVGTAEVLVIPEKPGTSYAATTLSNVSDAISLIKSVGDIIFIKLPTTIKVDITAKLTYDTTYASSYNTSMVATNATNAARKLINSSSVGSNLTISSIIGAVVSSSPFIKDCTILSSGGIIVDNVPHDLSTITSGDGELIYAGTISIS